jgi:hypothetical protein
VGRGHDRTAPLLSDQAISRASIYPDRAQLAVHLDFPQPYSRTIIPVSSKSAVRHNLSPIGHAPDPTLAKMGWIKVAAGRLRIAER